MTDTLQQELQHFVAKWYVREPEMQFAEIFVPAPEKTLFQSWGALLHELKHTLFELSDARVTNIKTVWWADEFQRLSNGLPRHPITQSLVKYDAAWASLSAGLMATLESSATRAGNTGQAIAHLLPVAKPLLDIEDTLFKSNTRSPSELFTVHCLLHRLPHGLMAEDQARIPMHLMARYSLDSAQLAAVGNTGLLQDWALELQAQLQHKVAGSLFRRARTRFDQARLASLSAGEGFVKPMAAKHLWRAWRAAVTIPK